MSFVGLRARVAHGRHLRGGAAGAREPLVVGRVPLPARRGDGSAEASVGETPPLNRLTRRNLQRLCFVIFPEGMLKTVEGRGQV